MTLATYAIKSGIPFETLEKDAFELLPLMNERGDAFTEDDVIHALEAYNDSYITYPIDTIVTRTGIKIEKNKRNGRKQKDHLERARAVQNLDYPKGEWRNKCGQPKKHTIVKEWREANPNGKKIECIRDTGLSKPTVLKWWEYNEKDEKAERAAFLKDLEEFCKRDAVEGTWITVEKGGKHYDVVTGEESLPFYADESDTFELDPMDSGWVHDRMAEKWGEFWLDKYIEYMEEEKK